MIKLLFSDCLKAYITKTKTSTTSISKGNNWKHLVTMDTGVKSQAPILSTAGAVPVKNEKGLLFIHNKMGIIF